MSTSLVIVESPAKARTIGRFLGDDFVVEASIGAIRDLDPKGLAVDIEGGFKPSYVVPAEKRDVVRRLKGALKQVDNVYLATDEDREGEAIAWHLAEVLKPTVPMRRMVFHDITRQAIENAINESRDIDSGLVDAQETRRIIDRLFGYPVSEVLWRKVSTGLSAGRVKSPSIRLIVQRERERMEFVPAGYWDLQAAFPSDPRFAAGLVGLDDRRVASGKDFDSSGRVSRDDVVVVDEPSAHGLVTALDGSTFTVSSVEEKPYRSSPKPPFITSTLQQEGGRKLGMSSAQVMRTAQGLYERGYITYMRTDSVTLSEEALTAARTQVRELYGDKFVPDAPRTYRGKVKNAQEAHARPALGRAPTGRPPPLRPDLEAHAGLADGRRRGQDGVGAHRRPGRVRPGRRPGGGRQHHHHPLGRLGPHHHVPRLPAGLRRGLRRPRRRSRRPRAPAARPHGRPGAARARHRPGGPHHPTPVPLHRGLAGQAARGARHRPPLDLRLDHADDPEPRLRLEEGSGVDP